MTSEQRFDPGKYLIKLSRRQKDGDGWKTVQQDYLQVRDRVLWLRTEHPDARITTEIVQVDGQHCIVRAHVVLPTGGEATGIGSETPDDWKDYIEKAETKALGRALAALGFGTAFAVDFDFEEPEKVVDAPVSRPAAQQAARQAPAQKPAQAPAQQHVHGGPPPPGAPSAGNGGWTEKPATEPQVKAIYAIARGGQGMDDGTLEEFCRGRYGCVPGELSRRQASELIDALKLGGAS